MKVPEIFQSGIQYPQMSISTYFFIGLVSLLGNFAHAQQRQDLKLIRANADSLLSVGQWQEADQVYLNLANQLNASQNWETYFDVQQDRAILYIQHKKYKIAEELLANVLAEAANIFNTKSLVYTRLLNTQAGLHFRQKQFETAQSVYLKYLHTLTSYHPDEATDIAKAFKNLALTYQQLGEYTQADSLLQQMMRIHEQLADTASICKDYLLRVKNLYYQQAYQAVENLSREGLKICSNKKEQIGLMRLGGNALKHQGLLNKALEQKKQTLALQLELEPDYLDAARAYFDLAEIYQYKREWEHAYDNYQKSLTLYANWEAKKEIAVIYRNLGRLFDEQKDFVKAEEYYYQAFVIRNELSTTSVAELASLLRAIASSLLAQNKIENALSYATKAHEFLEVVYAQKEESLELAASNYLLARIYLEQEKIETAKSLARKALKTFQQLRGIKHVDVSACYQLLAKSTPDSVLFFINQAYNSLVLDSLSVGENQNFEGVLDPVMLIDVLDQRAQLYRQRYQKDKNQDWLTAALGNYQIALELIFYTRQILETQTAKEWLARHVYDIFDRALEICWQLFNVTQDQAFAQQAFAFSEQSRSVLLLDALKDASAKLTAGISPDLLIQEQQLKNQIAYYKREIAGHAYKASQVSLQGLQTNLLKVKEQLTQLIHNFEQTYPKYYELKYNRYSVSIDHIQRALNNDRTLLEYHWSGRDLYVFVIQQSNFIFQKFPLDERFGFSLKHLRESIMTNPASLNPETAYQSFTQSARDLYISLIEPIEEFIKKTSFVTIIPSEELGYIPFEILLSQRPVSKPDVDFRSLSYLIKDYAISYAYSASTLFPAYMTKHTPSEKVYLGLAPAFDTEDEATFFAPLTYNRQEIHAASQYLKGKLFEGSLANERIFKQTAMDYKVLHLATHGVVDDEHPMYSYISLSREADSIEDGNLYVYELYNMQLTADLAVLSACNTGAGKLLYGEGIISLSRGFTYAGCPAIIMSLWTVNDGATSWLMEQFFAQIANGLSKDVAIQHAKLAYLNTVQNAQFGHPYYWAPFVAIGDPTPLNLPMEKSWALGILLSVCLSLIAFVLLRYIRMRKVQLGVSV